MQTLREKLTLRYMFTLILVGALSIISSIVFFNCLKMIEKNGKLININNHQGIASFKEKQSGQRISNKELDFLLEGLDKVVSAYQNDNENYSRFVVNFQIIVMILLLFTLIFSWVFIFNPLVKNVTEITSSISSERNYIALLLEVSTIANTAKTLDEAIKKTLEQVCIYTKWPIGHAYKRDSDDPDLLIPTKLWYLEDEKSYSDFKEITEWTPLKKGAGLPGRVLADLQPVWILDVKKDKNFPRNKVALELGVHSAFAFPILYHGRMIVCLEFFSNKIIAQNDRLLKIIAHIGSQLEQVCEREAKEIEIRTLNQSLEEKVVIRTNELRIKTEEVQAQQQLIINTSKMSALGEMAGGIAHEINTPLAIIQMKSEQLKEAAQEGDLDLPMLIESADIIETTVARIAKIIKGLRSFSRDGRNDPLVAVRIQDVLEETLGFCQEKFKSHGITLKIVVPSTPLIIECSSIQISQVILNLIHNAFDAIQGLKIQWVRIDLFDHDKHIEISITDSGSGISKNIQEKIMQPFFTTKEIGKGTGLGLSISRGIILSHSGQLSIDNNSKNTRFVILLPKVQGKQLT